MSFFDAFSAVQLALAAGIVFGAYVVRGMSGFGAGLVATPLLAYSAYMLIAPWLGADQLRLSQKWAWPLGFLGAFIDAVFGGGGGVLVVIYMHARGVGKNEFRATLAALWFVEMLARIGGYALAGFYTGSTLALVALMLPFMLLGTWMGEKFTARVSHETFNKILAVMLLFSGASLLLK
jgi:uncharacterized protein